MNDFYLTQIKRHNSGTYDKGVVIKNTLDAAKQSMHAYLGAYAYGADEDIDYVTCYIDDSEGNRLCWEVYKKVIEV